MDACAIKQRTGAMRFMMDVLYEQIRREEIH
jgi:hypothetical protein